MKSPKIKLPVTSYQFDVSRGFTPTPFTGGTVLPQTSRAPQPTRDGFREGISKSGAGFTIIELLVSVSIFALITGILLANYPKFSSRILLENVAHEIGLSVRQAQTYGLSVRGVKFGDDVFPPFGVHFSLEGISTEDPADRKHFLLFADVITDPPDGDAVTTNNDKIYNGLSNCNTTGGECVDLFSIQSAEQVVLLCGNLESTGATINDYVEDPTLVAFPGADCSLSSLDIAYTRPDPEASIKGYSETAGIRKTFATGEVVVQSPRGEYKTIVLWNTGQISTK